MATRNLLSGPITLSSATGRSANVLHALQYPLRKLAFYSYIEGHRALLAEVIAHHLGIKPTDVDISPQEWWRHGSFNLCVPLKVNVNSTQSNVPEFAFIRFPLPYRVGEVTNPGNSDEKLNCEAATYAWLEENCPSVPIPKLYGFGLSTNQRFTNASLLPWWSRWFHKARRFFLATFGLQQPSQYVCHASSRFADLNIGYLLIETITSGEMLSESWDEKRDAARLQNLQGDLARVMVSLARVRLPRIGLFRLDSNGYLRLDNRPMSVQTTMHENEGLSLHMSRRTTFSSVKDFVLSQIAAFETRFIEQPNVIASHEDAWYQMTSLAAAKLTIPQLFRDDLCNGPFVFSLTDLHRSNIFVDENWNITCIIDLEFACSWPVEFLQTPYWLGGGLIDEVTSAELAPIHAEFMEHIRREEKLQQCRDPDTEPVSSIMQQSWADGTFWVPLALRDPVSFTEIFYKRILKGYFEFPDEELDNGAYLRFCSRFFRRNSSSIIDRKLDDRDRYMESLTEAFTDTAARSS
ncbi:hypothetical protein MAC_08963 [Metarhizium acridum CQMa 102]|uniref:Aminoglycoside phosphotransferase domain-containing protein n=1 Tax=Metarhizium acridum (strain CQMa 102) TaxID=655827 RepID=E9EGG5_METAQ|nr:uncharacterized protein MAC_08963 [Metarhizium acridum CQMa 102]EFY84979.1 hypothetical protein MAC_08963 [Metarhizium acridum CQMa 102]